MSSIQMPSAKNPPARTKFNQTSAMATLAAALAICFAVPDTLLAQGRNLERNAYFGERNIQTSYSLDAWTFGDRNGTPGDSNKYFKGEPIKSPAGYDVKIDTVLDFAGVTDHSLMRITFLRKGKESLVY